MKLKRTFKVIIQTTYCPTYCATSDGRFTMSEQNSYIECISYINNIIKDNLKKTVQEEELFVSLDNFNTKILEKKKTEWYFLKLKPFNSRSYDQPFKMILNAVIIDSWEITNE